MKLSELKINPNNPQKFDDLSKLENSIKEFPKMMELRPIIYDSKNMQVLGGNKRLICLQNLDYKEIPDNWVKAADELTEDEKKRFILADNIGFGEWDWDILESEFESDELEEWGLSVENFNIDYSDKNQEINVDEFSDKMLLKFELSEDEFSFCMDKLSKTDANKENALLKILKYEP